MPQTLHPAHHRTLQSFAVQLLTQSTGGFVQSSVLRHDEQSTVYAGQLPDGTAIAVQVRQTKDCHLFQHVRLKKQPTHCHIHTGMATTLLLSHTCNVLPLQPSRTTKTGTGQTRDGSRKGGSHTNERSRFLKTLFVASTPL